VRFTVDPDIRRLGKFDVIGQQMTPDVIFDELGHVPGVTDEIEAAQRRAAHVAQPVHAPAPAYEPLDYSNNPAFDPAPYVPPVHEVEPVVEPPVPPMPSAPPVVPVTPLPEILPDPPPAAAPVAPPVTAVVRQSMLYVPGIGEVELQPGKLYIAGRARDNDFPLNDANVSRQHAEFYWDGQHWAVRDRESTNGTSVNGQPVTIQSLYDGDVITMGISEFHFSDRTRMATQ
jgi:hypothetical protein